MTEKTPPDTDECQHVSYHRPHWDENGKCSWVDIQLQHKLLNRYASQVLGAKDKILGIVHGVMPDTGSPAAYRRMKTGAGKEGIPGMILGDSAEKLMPVLAFAPGPLQLLPSPKYPSNWLKFEGGESYPNVDPFEEIYLRDDVWWRLYEPDILDKDKVTIQKMKNLMLS